VSENLVAGFDVLDSGADASTTPAASRPITTGYSCDIMAASIPAAMPLSIALSPAARTRIRTWPSATSGVGISERVGFSPAAGTCSARMCFSQQSDVFDETVTHERA
jgi:hypothetical protein